MTRGDRHITLRPEGTAPVVRSYVENKLFAPEVQKPSSSTTWALCSAMSVHRQGVCASSTRLVLSVLDLAIQLLMWKPLLWQLISERNRHPRCQIAPQHSWKS